MHLVDTHSHIDEYDNPESVVAEAEASGIYTIAVTNLPSAYEQIESLLQGRKYLRPALGLHPQNVWRYHFMVARMWRLLDRTRYVGEIGLDYSTSDKADRQVQRYVFDQILERCSSTGDKVLTVHSRHAAADVISAIGQDFPGKVILHWFTGSKRQLERASSYGFYFSINPAMMRSKRGASLIPMIPLDRLLTESDGPYVKVNGCQAHPRDTKIVIHAIASMLKADREEITELIQDNFRSLVTIEEDGKEENHMIF
jgi:TatD DNase family protein